MATLPSPDEFAPLPYYGWPSRPESVPLEYDEASTAIYLAKGDLAAAAKLLKVEPKRLRKAIRHYGRLQLLLTRLASPGDGMTPHNP